MNAFLKEPSTCDTLEARRLNSASAQAILYVEDDAIVRSRSARASRNIGYRVDVAEDGQVGWEALRFGNDDLWIRDDEMPRLTGLELENGLRSAGHALPVVMDSGTFSADEAQRDQSVPVAATLTRPFTSAQLLETVEEVLRAASSVRKRGEPFFPRLTETFARIQPVRGWGINE